MKLNLFPLLLMICLTESCQGKHLLRFLTFCQKNDTAADDSQYDYEFDGDQLLYVDPVSYQVFERLPEFAEQWSPDPDLARDTYISVGTCKYNLWPATRGEHFPPEVIVSPTSMIFPRQQMEPDVPNTLICLIDNLHPPAISVTWTRDGQPVDRSRVSQTQYYSNSDFSFRLWSYLSFSPQQGHVYACSVDHISLQEPLTAFWEVDLHTDQQPVETAVCVGGVILGLMGVFTGVWFIVKANKSC